MRSSELIAHLQTLPDAEILVTWEGIEVSIKQDDVYFAQGLILINADEDLRDCSKIAHMSGQKQIRGFNA